ncbi:hypothetical protein AAZX31_13G061700 [Glycine max]
MNLFSLLEMVKLLAVLRKGSLATPLEGVIAKYGDIKQLSIKWPFRVMSKTCKLNLEYKLLFGHVRFKFSSKKQFSPVSLEVPMPNGYGIETFLHVSM